MGAQFQVDVQVTTHAEQVEALEKKLESLQSKGINLKVNNIDTSKISRQMESVGQKASQSFNKAFSSGTRTSKVDSNSPINFAKMKLEAKKEIKGISKTIQAGLAGSGISERESDKLAQSFVNSQKKGLQAVAKERQKQEIQQRKAYEQQQRQQQKLSNSYWKDYFANQNAKSPNQKALSDYYKQQEKEASAFYKQQQKEADTNLKKQVANVEKLNQNKANIVTARANGKTSTLDALREERKTIKAEQKQLQKEAERYNNIPGYSQNERAKAIAAKQLGTKSLIDKAWASVQDKDSASIEKRFNSELAKAKKQLQTSISKNDYADSKEARDYLKYMDNLKASDWKNPLNKLDEVNKKVATYQSNLQSSHKTNLDNINKEIKAEEENTKQIQKGEEAKARLQRQEKISQLGYENRLKNAHNQEIMDRIQQTRQKYESQQSQLAKIQQRATSGEFEARNAKADKFLSRYEGQDSEVLTKARKYASELKSLQSELQSGVYASGDKKGLKIIPDDQVKLMDQINEKAKQLQNSFTEISNLESKTLGAGVATRSANNVASYMENNTRALKKYGSALSEIQQQYRSATTEMEKSNIDKSFATLKSRISAEGLTGNSAWSELKRATAQIAQFTGVYGALQNVMFQLPYKAITAVKDYDAAMTNMQMATGISNTQAQELMNTYSDMGKQLKVTGVDVATSATEWMKQGKTIEESNKLAQDSIVLSKIGDLSSDDATRTITAAMKSYDLNESQVMDFVDQISAIDMASATDVGGLADAFNEVAANANQAGISTKQLLSYAAVIGETTQEGMSSVGTSLNAIFSRMGNIKLARLKDYQNGGEDLSNVETVLKGVGISLRDTDGEFRNFGDVLDETAGRWSEFGTVQQRAVAQAFSGTNHMNDFMVLMQQYSKAQEYMQIADDASGTSMEKYSAYTDSLEGKLEGLKSTFESLSNTVLDSDALKGFVSGGTDVLGLIDKLTNSLGVMGTVAVGAGIFQGKNNSGKSTWDSPHAFFKMTYAA